MYHLSRFLTHPRPSVHPKFDPAAGKFKFLHVFLLFKKLYYDFFFEHHINSGTFLHKQWVGLFTSECETFESAIFISEVTSSLAVLRPHVYIQCPAVFEAVCHISGPQNMPVHT